MISEEKYCVEDCHKIEVTSFSKNITSICVDDIEITFDRTNTQFGGKRQWFVCPSCKSRRGNLLITPDAQFGCFHCLPVSYANQRYKGMIEEKLYCL